MKRILLFLLTFTPIFPMSKNLYTSHHDEDIAYIREQVIERLIGEPIPSTITITTKFNAEHTFEQGELVAIPSSTILQTKENSQQTYGRISSITNDGLTILYKPIQSSHFFEFTTPRRDLIGKIPPEILHRALRK